MANLLLFKDLSGWQRFSPFYFYFEIEVLFPTPFLPLSLVPLLGKGYYFLDGLFAPSGLCPCSFFPPHVSFPHSAIAHSFLHALLPALIFLLLLPICILKYLCSTPFTFGCFPHTHQLTHAPWAAEAGLSPINYSLGASDPRLQRISKFPYASRWISSVKHIT